jgi:hypothetical protein
MSDTATLRRSLRHEPDQLIHHRGALGAAAVPGLKGVSPDVAAGQAEGHLDPIQDGVLFECRDVGC